MDWSSLWTSCYLRHIYLLPARDSMYLETYRLKEEWKKMNKSDKPLIKLIMKKGIGPKSIKSEMKKKLQWTSQKYKHS